MVEEINRREVGNAGRKGLHSAGGVKVKDAIFTPIRATIKEGVL